jgi:hypothetical protein
MGVEVECGLFVNRKMERGFIAGAQLVTIEAHLTRLRAERRKSDE